jgi:multiple sugar transport system substrate-binding protein
MFHGPTRDIQLINRRRLLGFLSGAVAAGIITRSQAYAYLQDASEKTGVTAEDWNTETINAMAGTRTFDTAGDAHAIVPESTEGAVSFWNVGPTEASPDITKTLYQEFLDTFALVYPNITLDNQNIAYNDLLDKIRTAAAGGAAPDVAKMPILWGVEFAARGGTSEITFERVRPHGGAVLAGRVEVRDVGRQVLRRSHQQRDHGVHLEQADLRGRRPRSREPACNLG